MNILAAFIFFTRLPFWKIREVPAECFKHVVPYWPLTGWLTGGESFAMQYRRVSDFLDELKGKPYQRVAVFAHGGVLICAQIYAGIIKPEEAFSALTPYGGIVRITL